MKKLGTILLGLMATLSLVSCSHPPQNSPNGISVSDGYGEGEIQTVMMPDGNKCYVLIGYQKGAISCTFDK